MGGIAVGVELDVVLLAPAPGGAGDLVTVTAPEGQVVEAICIKSGNDAIEGEKHSGLITADTTVDGCYIVEGLGTDEVTVTRVDDSDCKDISHVDFGTGTAPTPTPTPAGGSPTPTPTEGGGVAGGNPTPTPGTLPNTSTSPQVTFPTALLTLLLIGSLGSLAYVRMTTRR